VPQVRRGLSGSPLHAKPHACILCNACSSFISVLSA
jgi:hypothetical protein